MSAENLHTEKKFSFSGMKSSVMNFVSTQLFRFEKKNIEQKMREPVNNYFKTPEEMEADFSPEISVPYVLKEQTAEEIYLLAISHYESKDGYFNIPDPVNINAGFMEENY